MLSTEPGVTAGVPVWLSGAGMAGDRTIRALNRTLATELVCALRCRQHYFLARDVYRSTVSRQLLERCRDAEANADLLAARIVQLGGIPDFDPCGLAARSQVRYEGDVCLLHLVEEDLLAERIAMDSCREMVADTGPRDPVTRRILERILAAAEQHSVGLNVLLADMHLVVETDR